VSFRHPYSSNALKSRRAAAGKIIGVAARTTNLRERDYLVTKAARLTAG